MKVSLRPCSIPMLVAALMALATAVPAAAQTSSEPMEVQLDDSGVAPKFVNPLDPLPLARDQPLRFSNTTGDRTFIVTVPFVTSDLELASAYAVADEERGRKVVYEIVCAALERNGGDICTPEQKEAMKKLEGLRVLYEAVSIAQPTSLADHCDSVLKGSDCIVETLFWRAACARDNPANHAELLEFARRNEAPPEGLRDAVKTEAEDLVKEFFGPQRSKPVTCDFQGIKGLQDLVNKELPVTSPLGPIDPVAAEAKSTGLMARFGANRAKLAKKELQDAISARMDEEKLKTASVLVALEGRRKALQKDEKPGDMDPILQCRLREVEAAAKLLTSYGLGFKVPYSGIPATLASGQSCATYRQPQGEEARSMPADQAQRTQARNIRAERASEQGIEITDCKTAGSSTTCVATATIPPYQYATFSPSILAHQPKALIAFTTAFFGETEIPANANGYVLRAGETAAGNRPEKAFTLSLGGDASSALDPNDEVQGQLRHTGSSGTLSFLFTGTVEASATLQFKQGDFGGPVDSNKIGASQYQGKVFGHKPKVFENIRLLKDQAISLQYGRLQFAKPSSGIAVSVFGEGLQLALGSASLAYVVLRESDNPKEIADTQNDDSSLWILQLKNVALSVPVLRTFDVIALRGEDRKDQEKTTVDDPSTTFLPVPFKYWSLGGEVRWGTERVPALGGSFAGYYSERNVGASPPNPDPTRPVRLDGKGWTALARVSLTPLVFPDLTQLEKVKPHQTFGASLLLGYGTGDDKKTTDEDEGYLGENAGFSNDVLFLSRVSKAFPKQIGSGLANKWYGGLQLTDAQADWLAKVPKLLGVGEDEIASTSTVLSLHTYRFVREVQGLHSGGIEADVELNVEAPKKIRWSLGGAYYHRSEALKLAPISLDHDLWSVTAKLSIGLSYP